MDWKETLASLSNLPKGEQHTTDDVIQKTVPSHQGMLHVVVEKKGRGGKIATIIHGFECSDDEIDEVARNLKRRLGAGGSARGGEILIQGDRRDYVCRFLRDAGFKVK